ncbi:MAG: hypothetical protein ACETWC_08080 [Acidobacteriota bacterium]
MGIHGYIGAGVIAAAEILMLRGVQPVAAFFTPIVWWGYILLVDAIVLRINKKSLIVSRPREFLLLLPLSIGMWLIFELYNLFIRSWHYLNLPDQLWMRLLGYGFAFATIAPALLETAELISSFGWVKRLSQWPPRNFTPWLTPLFIIGVVSLVLPFIFPSNYMSPLVWLGFIFLLEPVNYRFAGNSLLKDWEEGNGRRLVSLLLAGFWCGILWEFWNYWAYTKWVYTVPFLPEIKIFEMPILGYFGFPFFTVECFLMYSSLRLLIKSPRYPQPLNILR